MTPGSKATLDMERTGVCVRGGQCTSFNTITGVMLSQDKDFTILSSLVFVHSPLSFSAQEIYFP